MNSIKVYCDGGSRGNPGPAAYGFVVYVDYDREIHKESKFIGEATNNVAEYTGILKAIEWLADFTKGSERLPIEVFLDSELAVKQLKGIYRIKNEALKDFAIKIKSLIENNNLKIVFTHVRRGRNQVADSLVNKALDAL